MCRGDEGVEYLATAGCPADRLVDYNLTLHNASED